MEQQFKRNVAYKMRIGDLLVGRQIFDADKFKFLEIGDRQVYRVNVIANVIEKYVQEGEKKFASLTLDDASGQIQVRAFGDDVVRFEEFSQGDTVQVVGLVRFWNNSLYLTSEILKKRVPEYLLLRKLETDLERPKEVDKSVSGDLRDKIISLVKKEDEKGGVDVSSIIMELKSSPDLINSEIRKMLEEGIAYEPRPGKLRWLG